MTGILIGIKDLMLRSRVEESAKALGVAVKVAGEAGDALNLIRIMKPRLVILDLEEPALAPLETISAVRRETAIAETPIVGFLSHTNQTRMERAIEAGCTEVLPRSAFVERLPEILSP